MDPSWYPDVQEFEPDTLPYYILEVEVSVKRDNEYKERKICKTIYFLTQEYEDIDIKEWSWKDIKRKQTDIWRVLDIQKYTGSEDLSLRQKYLEQQKNLRDCR